MNRRIRCGSCHDSHETVAQVRLCYETKARTQSLERAAVKAAAPAGEGPDYTAAIQQRERLEDEVAYAAKAARDEELEAAQLLDRMTGAPGRDMASDRQVKYVMDLLAQHQWPDTIDEDAVRNMERRQVSKLIEGLKDAPKRSDPIDAFHGQGPSVGMYIADDGTLRRPIRVYLGQKSGRNLVKIIENTGGGDGLQYKYRYIGSALMVAQGRTSLGKVKLERMSKEDAMEWGKLTGTCIVCGRRLDVPESVERGIGPVCANKEW